MSAILSSNRRVVVTGMGVVSPIGLNAKEAWKNAIKGCSGVAPITLFDPAGSPVTIAAEVKGYDPTAELSQKLNPAPGHEVTQICPKKEIKKMGRFIHLSLGACMEAYIDSGLDSYRSEFPAHRFGVNIGAGMGGLPEIEKNYDTIKNKGYKRVTPFFIPGVIINMASGQISIMLNIKGPNVCNVTACSSSGHSIGESYRMIQRGDAEVMMAGGAEAVICPCALGGFASMKALSSRNDDPEKASRPFDKERDGFIIGEGAATLILEEYEFAKKRGAKIYAELRGYGLSGDAYHMTAPAPEGEGGYRAMKQAISNAHIRPEQISYINAHGTSTLSGDAEEALAIARLFPNAKEHLQVSSTKSMTGHLLGAAGALESFFSIQAMNEGIIPPTINLENLDEKCAALGIDFAANKAQKRKIEYACSNSFGFGGTNASLIFGRPE